MLATAIIIFREVLEIALILGIVLAATQGFPKRFSLVGTGLLIGAAGSALIAVFTDSISNAIDGMGQEVFNAGIMFVAVGLLSWTVIWMRKHGRELAQHLTAVSQNVMAGKKPLYILIAIVAVATFREGAEIVLFLYSMAMAGQYAAAAITGGALLGLVAGMAVGGMFYYGLLKAARKHIFFVTGWMLILLTAGLAAQGAGFLIAAGIIPDLVPQVWDTSAVISGDGIAGKVLGALIGYTPRPSGMELLFYVSVLLAVGAGYSLVGHKGKPVLAPPKAA